MSKKNIVEIRIIKKDNPRYDHEQVEFIMEDGTVRGVGYQGKKEGDPICVTRCPDCERENYPLVVAKGICALCGFDPNNSTIRIVYTKLSEFDKKQAERKRKKEKLTVKGRA